MSEFALGVEERIAQIRASLAQARAAEDEDLVEVLLGDLKSLVDLADNNDLETGDMRHILAVETGAIPIIKQPEPAQEA